eukprot:TRINITY_DN2914_c2_g1_i1.p1 TRINITY_DN2914_c2_g1~~TRINITY_DN2914_c2_g1_i1.p1  ORF type:complete len:242 (-),score=68.91 TRINITY_DN2914_c2_g1_i1:186-911(-)
MKYLTSEQAFELDQRLFDSMNFPVETLVEFAANCITNVLISYFSVADGWHRKRILFLCGPGNNGLDSVVSARILSMLGYENVFIFCTSKVAAKENFYRLSKQACIFGCKLVVNDNSIPLDFDLIVDGFFGFSFSGIARQPYATFLEQLVSVCDRIPIVSIDVPSGWNVNEPVQNFSKVFKPVINISLTCPKCCASFFDQADSGIIHILGAPLANNELGDEFSVSYPPAMLGCFFIEVSKDD